MMRDIYSFPVDFRQLLEQHFSDEFDREPPRHIVVSRRALEQFRAYVWLSMAGWRDDDFVRAGHFALELASGRLFPPLICDGGELWDGHHRVYGMFVAGIDHWDVIDIALYRPAATTQRETSRETADRV